ncbi:heavy metal-responsive transcriptional regulator [Crocosphaera chwakensis]|uniref:Transcriptional regulator n=1 Tax=Crocosphaera chwakensis CCY0110 TaxID=391612 RepID=A3IK27_9CHRO|nr:heavy metal-responsive transcriptional regulator [Crocosphaera chwakensis]EAZ93016.1 transcriptional regulator [Crocosphaera chwakensis CCY0110]
MKKMFNIGEVAHRLNLNPQTIYFYERKGLIPPVTRDKNGYRFFSEEDITRLSLIVALKGLGMTLEEIKEILDLKDNHCLTCEEVAQELQEKILQINTKISQLTTVRNELSNLLQECCTRTKSQSSPCECTLLDELQNINCLG